MVGNLSMHVCRSAGQSQRRSVLSRRPAQAGHESEPRLLRPTQIGAKRLLHKLFDFGRTATGSLIRRRPVQRRTIRFEPELDPQEIVLAERIVQFVGRHLQQRE